MACNQTQIKKFPWTPKRAASLLDEAMRDFIDKGKNFTETINGLSARHGIKREIIAEGLQAAKGVPRNITDEMWLRNRQRRAVEAAARNFTQDINKPDWQKRLEYAANIPRRMILSGHFAAFTKSHLSDQAFYNPKLYAENFYKSWSLIRKEKAASQLEREIDQMTQGTEDKPIYQAGVRAGADITPGGGAVGAYKTETREVTGTPKETRSSLAFDRLRVTRYKIWKQEYQKLSPEEKADRTQLEALAHVINNDTGTTPVRAKVANFLFLAPRLFPAQLKHTFIDIPKALFQTGMGLNYKNAAPAMRYVARKTAILASAQTAILAANYGLGIATGDKRFQPNLGNLTRTDWLRPRLFGFGVPISPTVELMKAPFMMIAAGRAAKAGDNPTAEALMRGLEVMVGRQNPLLSIGEEALFGSQPGTGRPLPSVTGHNIGLVTQGTEGPTRPKETWTEFLGTNMPIWMSNYVHEIYDEMREQGMNHPDAKAWITALSRSTLEDITSYHLSRAKEDFGFPTRTIQKGQPGYGQYRHEVNAAMKRYQQFKKQEMSKPQPQEAFGIGQK